MSLLRAIWIVTLLIACGSSTTTIYRDSWQPIEIRDAHGRPRLLVAAMFIDSNAVDAMRQVDAVLIGYHATRKGWALRAGSTGGTHFLPIAEISTGRTNCATLSPSDWLSFTQCSSQASSQWTRVAVFRVEPTRWHELPVWLIPPRGDVVTGVSFSAARDGCQVNRSNGAVRCAGDWNVVGQDGAAIAALPATQLAGLLSTSGDESSAAGGTPTAGKQATKLGTGFAIDGGGTIVTAYHVVQDGRAVVVRFAGSKDVIAASVIRTVADADLAVLQTHQPPPDYVTVGVTTPRVGQPVFTMGFPDPELLGTEPKFTDGTISALSGPTTDAQLMQISVPIQPGNSGGPLLNDGGEVIGVVISSAAAEAFYGRTGALPQNVNFASKVEALRSVLGDQPATHTPTASREEAIARAGRAVCIVEAFP